MVTSPAVSLYSSTTNNGLYFGKSLCLQLWVFRVWCGGLPALVWVS
jgi:hypothetical protein